MEKLLSSYRQESDVAFRKMTKDIGNHYNCYFALLLSSDGGCYELVRKDGFKSYG